MCSVAVRAGGEGRAGEGRARGRARGEGRAPRETRPRQQPHCDLESRYYCPLLAGLILCHAKVKRDPFTSSYFYDSGGKVVGWEGQTKLRY